MTPAEHRAEAERLLEMVEIATDEGTAFTCLRKAHVHAELAKIPDRPGPPENVTGWLYCLCPRNRKGFRVADNPQCPIHGEQP